MAKAPQPSPWGLVVVLALFVGLFWYGSLDRHQPEVSKALQQGTIDCTKDLKYLTPTQLELCIDIQSFKKDSDYE